MYAILVEALASAVTWSWWLGDAVARQHANTTHCLAAAGGAHGEPRQQWAAVWTACGWPHTVAVAVACVLALALFVGTLARIGRWTRTRGRNIADRYHSEAEILAAIRGAGIEVLDVSVAVDFTASNATNGRRTFGGRSLHDVSRPDAPNPYQRVIRVLQRCVAKFDDDGMIPAWGFGDDKTRGRHTFNLNPEGGSCAGFDALHAAYEVQATERTLSGPTSFAPAIRAACAAMKRQDARSLHMLIIVCDGAVTERRETTRAIVEAARFPLEIVCVGVGDGPWDEMERYDDELPERAFDNFQFVRWTPRKSDAQLTTELLQELPEAVERMRALGLLPPRD